VCGQKKIKDTLETGVCAHLWHKCAYTSLWKYMGPNVLMCGKIKDPIVEWIYAIKCHVLGKCIQIYSS